VELSKVIAYTMQSLITTFFQLAPPRTKGQGTKSIDCDLSRMFVDRKYFASNFNNKNPKVQELVRGYFKSNNYDAIQTMQKDGAIFKNIRIKKFDKSDIKRNNRGRIIKSYNKVLVTDPKVFKDYVKGLKANVGKLKGSFINALEHFGGGSWPGWIKKNQLGYYTDNTKAGQTLGIQSASAISRVPYGYSVDQRMNLVNRTYAVQSGKLVGMVKANVLNAALTKYFSVSSPK